MKRVFFAFAWFFLSTGVVLSLLALTQFTKLSDWNWLLTPFSTTTIASSNSEDSGTNPEVKGVETVIQTGDARALLVSNFLRRYNSPLQPYDHFGEVFVAIADRYGFDFRLLPAIAMQESNLCKTIPENSYNCLGFGIHERGTLAFESFEANFERAGRELKAYYIDRGLDTPEKIMKKYTPSSDGSWARSVNQWMAEMQYDDRATGQQLNDKDHSVLEFAQPTPPPDASTSARESD